MLDDYQIPATALITALLLAFGYLDLRFRSVRIRLWLVAMVCVEIHSVLFWRVSNSHSANLPWGFGGGLSPTSPWMAAVGESALMFASALFLASLSPLTFRIGKLRVMYVIPYTIPLVAYSVLIYGVTRTPGPTLLWVYVGLAAWALVAGMAWSVAKGMMPVWLSTVVVGAAALVSAPFFLHGSVYWPLVVVQSGNMVMVALLLMYTFRRLSPGVFLATLGFLAWSIPPILGLDNPTSLTLGALYLARTMILGKVAAAIGLILIVLEDEIAKNQLAGFRERRVRLELEAYSRLLMTARSLEEFDRESGNLCAAVAEHSRFSKVALLTRTTQGNFTLIGAAGLDGATVAALDALAQRLQSASFDMGRPKLAPDANTLDMDLEPWLTPGDDLERMKLVRMGAVPMLGPERTVEGAVLLAGLRNPQEELRADDLLAVESLAGRIQAARSQALMLGKLIDSERFAGVGQLATNVAQELNNPLTVILGYAGLLEESVANTTDARAAEAILSEARRMKALLERIAMFSRHTTERFATFSAGDLMADMEQLHRMDFLRYAIDFRMSVAPDLPPLVGNAHQIRQALMHAVQYAIESVQRVGADQAREVRLGATARDGHVRILVGHSGRSFAHPERAFDSLSTGVLGTDAAGIGLSLCAAIIREHNGRIEAMNLEPNGAAVALELPSR
jgi:signal transduction histidine kinase